MRSFSCKWFDSNFGSLSPKLLWHNSVLALFFNFFFSFSSPSCVVPPPLCATQTAPAQRPSAQCRIRFCSGGLALLPPPHVRSLGLESNTQNGCFRAAVLNSALKCPVCACEGCTCQPLVSNRSLGFGNRYSLALVWVSKMMDRSVRGETVAVKCANVVSGSCLPSCVCLGFGFYFIFYS